MKFHLKMVPPTTTHQAKKVTRIGGFTRIGDKPELTQALNSYEQMLRPFVPNTPVEGPTKLKLTFVWPYLKGEKKRVVESGQLVPRLSKPDSSNLAKTFEDRLVVMRILATDQQVYDIQTRKYFGPESLVGVHVEVSL